MPAKVRDAERRCPRERGEPVRVWSHHIGAERSATLSSGTSFAQVAGVILCKQSRVENPETDEVSSPVSVIDRPCRPEPRASMAGVIAR